jgi:hypothetical protein
MIGEFEQDSILDEEVREARAKSGLGWLKFVSRRHSRLSNESVRKGLKSQKSRARRSVLAQALRSNVRGCNAGIPRVGTP